MESVWFVKFTHLPLDYTSSPACVTVWGQLFVAIWYIAVTIAPCIDLVIYFCLSWIPHTEEETEKGKILDVNKHPQWTKSLSQDRDAFCTLNHPGLNSYSRYGYIQSNIYLLARRYRDKYHWFQGNGTHAVYIELHRAAVHQMGSGILLEFNSKGKTKQMSYGFFLMCQYYFHR